MTQYQILRTIVGEKKKKKNVPLKLIDMVDVPDILFILYFYIVFSSCCEAPDLKYTYLLTFYDFTAVDIDVSQLCYIFDMKYAVFHRV